jgi:hypothetical protein
MLQVAVRRLASVAFLALPMSGCATGRGDLPLGEWAGRGTFIYEEWAPGGPAGRSPAPSTASAGVTISRDYETTLSLRPDRLADTNIVRMEIRSRRGELPSLEDETHIIAALVPGKRVNANARLYQAIALQYNPKPDEALTVADDAPPYLATCTTTGGVTTFQIWYAENFVDVFRFSGLALEKAGVFFEEERGLVHWNEKLSRKR